MKKAKNFKLLGTSNKLVELNKIKSKYTVLYFYPKDDTPGCTLCLLYTSDAADD